MPRYLNRGLFFFQERPKLGNQDFVGGNMADFKNRSLKTSLASFLSTALVLTVIPAGNWPPIPLRIRAELLLSKPNPKLFKKYAKPLKLF